MRIPYGVSDFNVIREDGYFYADKTTFLPVLEEHYRHVVFLRPRRFGKSTLISMLEHYYDLGKAKRFDELFKGLWVHEHPTAERSRYLIFAFDFSGVGTDTGVDHLRRAFAESVRGSARTFILKYRDLIPPLNDILPSVDRIQEAADVLGAVLSVISATSYRSYVLIDEYDHFANRLLAGGAEDVYESVVTKTGFVRSFYATLESGTRTGAVGRMFVTGVSPLMLDDLSSGFNIASHASLSRRVSALAGFTRAETEQAVDEFLAERPTLSALPELGDRGALLGVLEAHYNGYRFSPDVDERVFNSDMVLYFLKELGERGSYPRSMLDRNVRTEYGHLQRIGTLSGTGSAARLTLLQTILSAGHIRSQIVDQFGIKSLASHAPFLSLLYFLGMLTLGSAPRDLVGDDLEIPNRVIRELQWEHLAVMLKEEANVTIDVDELRVALRAMAGKGQIEPFLSLFQRDVLQVFSNRDMRGLDEKTIKLLLLTYASTGGAFYPLSDKEFAQGYCDVFLSPAGDLAGANYAWLLELKYIKASAKPAQIEAAFAEAEAQVERYASDEALLPISLGRRALKAGMLVFVGAKKALFRPWEPVSSKIAAPKRSVKAAKTARAAKAAKAVKTVKTVKTMKRAKKG